MAVANGAAAPGRSKKNARKLAVRATQSPRDERAVGPGQAPGTSTLCFAGRSPQREGSTRRKKLPAPAAAVYWGKDVGVASIDVLRLRAHGRAGVRDKSTSTLSCFRAPLYNEASLREPDVTCRMRTNATPTTADRPQRGETVWPRC